MTLLRFPLQAIPDQPKCRVCGAPLELLKYEIPRDKCFCCLRTIPLFGRPCPECEGNGWVAVHVCRDEAECQKACPQQQQCMACLGTGKIGG